MMKMGKTQQQHGKWLSTLTVCTAALGSLVLLSVPQTASAATTDTSLAITGAVVNTDTTAEQSADTTNVEKQATTPESTVNTDQLQTTSSNLQTAVDTAKETGVIVTQNPTKTVTTTPDQLADTVNSVKADNDAQAQTLAEATTKQVANQADYDQKKQAYDDDTVAIVSTNTDAWSDDQLVKLLAGNGDVMKTDSDTDVMTGDKVSAVTEADKIAASDEAKAVSTITLSPGAVYVPNWDTLNPDHPDGSIGEPIGDNQPTWTYENAFTDVKTGRKVNVIETVTGYTQAKPSDRVKGAAAIKHIDSGDIGFQPQFVDDVTVTLKYVYADTGEAATIDAILAFSDLDGNQGVKVNNGYASALIGSNLINVDGAFRDHDDHTTGDTDAEGQAWVLQRNVTETDYTFYVGLNPDGTVNNTEPFQHVGGVAFSTKLPDMGELTQEKASYTPTTIQVTTDYTVHYEGAGTATPADVTKVVTWTGNYDSATDAYTWTPDNGTLTAVTPVISGYRAVVSTGWNLKNQLADPADQTQTVTYYQVGTVANDDAPTNLTVHYVDEHGNELIPVTSQGGQIGTDFSVTAPDISQYTPMNQKTVTGMYQGNQMVLYFVYKRNASGTTGTPTTSTTTTTGTPTTTPATPAPSTAVATETPTSTATVANGTAVTNNPTESATTANEQQNATSQASQGTNGQFHLTATTANASHATWQYAKSQATAQQTSNTAAATTQLPQTDEQTSTTSTLLGLGLLSLFFGLFGITRRKRQDN